MIVSIYSIYAARLYINPSLGNLAVKQLLWYGLGIVVFWILTKVPAKWIIKGIYPFYAFMILSLVGLLFFGTSSRPVPNMFQPWREARKITLNIHSPSFQRGHLTLTASLLNGFPCHKKGKRSQKDYFTGHIRNRQERHYAYFCHIIT